ncbi:MAG: hypothetical protein AAFP19_06325 [Bacteroidota bacterium]
MALLRFFKTPRHQKFEYRPRHWDPRKEELEERVKQAKARANGDTTDMKSRISTSMRRGFNKKRGNSSSKAILRSNMILLAVILVLIMVSYLVLTVYLPEIINMIE